MGNLLRPPFWDELVVLVFMGLIGICLILYRRANNSEKLEKFRQSFAYKEICKKCGKFEPLKHDCKEVDTSQV